MAEAFTLLLKNIANLFKVKTILSLLVIVTTCILTFRNVVSVEAFMTIAASIITYYFTRKENKNTEDIQSNIENVENETTAEEIVEDNIKEREE